MERALWPTMQTERQTMTFALKSIRSAQIRRISVIRGLSFRTNCLAIPDRPRMTLIRRICAGSSLLPLPIRREYRVNSLTTASLK